MMRNQTFSSRNAEAISQQKRVAESVKQLIPLKSGLHRHEWLALEYLIDKAHEGVSLKIRLRQALEGNNDVGKY